MMTRLPASLLFFLFFALLLAPGSASANSGVLVLVTEVNDDGAQSFWWSGSAPAWTATDVELRAAMEREGAGFAEPAAVANLSKIYRRPSPTDANALGMASVLGHDRLLVGTATVSRSELAPLGAVGISVRLDVRLLAATSGGPEVVSRIDVTRVQWAQTEDEARTGARTAAATAVARTLAGGMARRVGPVGITTGELLVAVRDVGSGARLDAVRSALLRFAGVTEVAVRWASEGLIALEVNPSAADPSESVKQYANLLAGETFEGFSLVPSDSKFPETVEFRVVEAQ